MNRGYLRILDGAPGSGPPAPDRAANGLARMGGAIEPPPHAGRPAGPTFAVDLYYAGSVHHYVSGRAPAATGMTAPYSRSFKRLASGANPLKDAVDFISQFSGCAEARKVRGRAIALARIRKSLSGEVFRFPVEGP